MKRILTALTALLLAVALCCSAAFASGNTYYLEEVDADIALPSWEDYYYLYPDMPADSEDLTYLELTPEEINAILIPNGILFDALYYDASHEIAVQVNDSDIEFDYSQLSKTERTAVITASTLELEALGYTVHTMEWVEGENEIWLVTEFSLPGGGGWAYQYHTARGGKTLLFTASSAAGAELTDEIRQATAAMALGTVFHGVSVSLPGGEDPAPVTDIDELEDMLGGIDLDGLDLSNVDMNALADALGLTEEELLQLAQGELETADLDLSKVDPQAVMDALGLTEEDLIDFALSAAGAGDLDWKGLLLNAGRGALIGFGVGVLVVVLIIVLLAVSGRKKRSNQKEESEKTNHVSEE